MPLPQPDEHDLKYAKMLLENPSFASKIINVVGVPFEKGLEYLPANWSGQVHQVTEKALHSALKFAIISLGSRERRPPSDGFHKMAVMATGGAGGMFGIAALSVELPISTALMLRSIADIARSEGEDLVSIETRLACLEVFALGGRSKKDDGTETGYFAVRAALSKAVYDAAKHIAERGLAKKGAPVLVRLIGKIASRFGVVVSEKAAASAVPILGAAGGALTNTIFIDHFQDMARGHFIVRRLERHHGADIIKAEYDRL